MIIAVDAMGGDHAPKAQVQGALLRLKENKDLRIQLYGDRAKILSVLDGEMIDDDRLQIIHCTEVVTGEDEPVRAVRKKKDSSMVRAAEAVRKGKADACVSAGNTGALMAAGLFVTGRIKGIHRPALAPVMPTMDGKGFLMLDVGANADSKPEHLLQFAIMGSIYAEKVRGIERPTVGLLNIGTEEGKGNELTKEAYALLKDAPIHFIGNVESRDLLDGVADVVVTDGYTGNMVLKTLEGTALHILSMLKDVFMSSTKTKIGALLVKNDLKKAASGLDYKEHGGAGLFGLRGPVIKAHGSSDEQAMFNAIRQAETMVKEDVVSMIEATIRKEDTE